MATISRKKKLKHFRQKLALFRANEPSISVLMWSMNYSFSTLSNLKPRITLLKNDYKARMKVKVNNIHFNKENMPSRFKFKEYCPMVFRNLRSRFGVDCGDYLMAFNKHQPVWDSILGKSGSKFLVTYNRQFVAKTVSVAEVDQLNEILEEYYAYIATCNGRTLLPQFLGLYRISVNDQETYILVMRNVFSPRLAVHKVCNLKSKTMSPQKNSDLNDVCKIYLGESTKSEFMTVLESDIQFLQENNLMGYSLVIGLHEIGQAGGAPSPQASASASAAGEPGELGCRVAPVYASQSAAGCEEEQRGASMGDGLGGVASATMLHRLSLHRAQSTVSEDNSSDDDLGGASGDDLDTLVGSGFSLGDAFGLPSNGPYAHGNSFDGTEALSLELYPYIEYYAIRSSAESPRPLIYFLAIVNILNRHGARKRSHRAHGSGQDGGQMKPEAYGRRIIEFTSQCIS